MLRALILEDEAPARERLAGMLAEPELGCIVVGAVDSLAAATRWLRENPAPDLLFADIQLGDGLSLDLFKAAPPPCPIVFTTAHDEYLLEAFATHGIAYLLKPIKRAELAAAVRKHHDLGRHYAATLASLAARITAPPPPPAPARQRILAQRGTAFQPVAIADVAYFLSEGKLTFLVTHARERCLVNPPLAALEAEFDRAQFFRVNRNYLAHISAVKRFASVGKGRLEVELQPAPAEPVLVSQETAAAFRAWAGR
ncbi:MAG TPA: LytTR family DNA-binding domain-containing protein [Opitutaceae bacterium]